eukprot:3555599-Alexandrium_andersonii.AAC.1
MHEAPPNTYSALLRRLAAAVGRCPRSFLRAYESRLAQCSCFEDLRRLCAPAYRLGPNDVQMVVNALASDIPDGLRLAHRRFPGQSVTFMPFRRPQQTGSDPHAAPRFLVVVARTGNVSVATVRRANAVLGGSRAPIAGVPPIGVDEAAPLTQ